MDLGLWGCPETRRISKTSVIANGATNVDGAQCSVVDCHNPRQSHWWVRWCCSFNTCSSDGDPSTPFDSAQGRRSGTHRRDSWKTESLVVTPFTSHTSSWTAWESQGYRSFKWCNGMRSARPASENMFRHPPISNFQWGQKQPMRKILIRRGLLVRPSLE